MSGCTHIHRHLPPSRRTHVPVVYSNTEPVTSAFDVFINAPRARLNPKKESAMRTEGCLDRLLSKAHWDTCAPSCMRNVAFCVVEGPSEADCSTCYGRDGVDMRVGWTWWWWWRTAYTDARLYTHMHTHMHTRTHTYTHIHTHTHARG